MTPEQVAKLLDYLADMRDEYDEEGVPVGVTVCNAVEEFVQRLLAE